MRRCGMPVEVSFRGPCLIENEVRRVAIRDMKIVLNAPVFLAGWLNEAKQVLTNFILFAGLRENFCYYREQGGLHGLFSMFS